ncbi:hypothetical protein ACL02S_02720 [Nocardia sp. 004]|uniref:hypothetical protein n=1 Tax=Nocardia sp. 004 TaxID=3385978 RepID=UPI0039A0A8E2
MTAASADRPDLQLVTGTGRHAVRRAPCLETTRYPTATVLRLRQVLDANPR